METFCADASQAMDPPTASTTARMGRRVREFRMMGAAYHLPGESPPSRSPCGDSSAYDVGSLPRMLPATSITTSKTCLHSSVIDGSPDCPSAPISTNRINTAFPAPHLPPGDLRPTIRPHRRYVRSAMKTFSRRVLFMSPCFLRNATGIVWVASPSASIAMLTNRSDRMHQHLAVARSSLRDSLFLVVTPAVSSVALPVEKGHKIVSPRRPWGKWTDNA